jgi:hypothetical protein
VDKEPSLTEIPQGEPLDFFSNDLVEGKSVRTAICNEFCIISHGSSPLSIINIIVNNQEWRSRMLWGRLDSENGTARFVMPAQASIQFCIKEWVPASAGTTKGGRGNDGRKARERQAGIG